MRVNGFATFPRDPARMSRYRRLHLPGVTSFFTVCLAERGSSLLLDRLPELREAWRRTLAEHPARVDAVVILPDHLHAVWTLPPGDADSALRWRKIKGRFTHALGRRAVRTATQERRREGGIWQRRFWEHVIFDEEDYRAHLAYCWANPVRHGLVAHPAEWAPSSLHRDLRAGRVPSEWGGTADAA